MFILISVHQGWNFAEWYLQPHFSPMRELTIDRDNWAKTVSPNKEIKIYLGAAASPLAATSGYVDSDTLASCALNMRDHFSSFAGIMLWDASWAYGMLLAFIG